MERSLRYCVDPAGVDRRPDAGLLAEAVRTNAPWLFVGASGAEAISVGRFVPPPPAGAVSWAPRLTGGRVVPLGPGFVRVALALPHRAALVGDDPLALSPEQVLNRCVRGVMAGCKAIGTELFYPGRDLLTVGSRVCGMVTFTVEPGGATLFEAVLAVERDFALLPFLLDRGDPAGRLRAEMWQPEQVVALGARWTRRVGFVELAERIAAGYASTFGLTVQPTEAPPGAAPAGCAPVAEALDRHGSVSTMLGVLEAHVAVLASGQLSAARITGDLIADPAGVAALEARLVGCPANREDVQRVVDRVYALPQHFVLGIGPTATLTDAIVRAAVG